MFNKLFSNSTAKWNGLIDGRKGIPSADANTSTPFENRVRDKANQVISKIYGRWQKTGAKLSSKLQEAQSRHVRALGNYEQSKDASGRDARPKPHWYFPFILMLGIVELYINREVFARFGFQHSENIANHESWFLALVLSFSLPVAGHFLGRILRERSRNKNKIKLWLATITAIASASTITYISWLRATTILAGDGSAFDARLWLFFLSLNLLVFLVAIIASYYCHEEDQDIRGDKQDFEKKERNLRVMEGRRNSHNAVYKNRAEAVNHRYKELINIYRQANIRNRKDRSTEAFKQMPPDIDILPFVLVESAELKPASPETTDGPSVVENSKIATYEDGHSTNQKLKPEERMS